MGLTLSYIRLMWYGPPEYELSDTTMKATSTPGPEVSITMPQPSHSYSHPAQDESV